MSYCLKPVTKISDIGQAAWDACANPYLDDDLCGIAYDPFVSYHFLSALEQSGSVSAQTGWAPYHIALAADETDTADILGVMPLYLKSHSQGEYVFDHSWADAFERAGGRYYPKLQSCVPFTPASGRRLLTPNVSDANEREKYLIGGMKQLAEQLGVSSVHVTFANQTQYQHLGDEGLLQRTHNQFHWLNQGYKSFDDFLAELSSKKRKNIRRERRVATENGVTIERLSGSDITEAHWDAFYEFYVDTGGRKWGSPYLNRAFFSLIGQSMGQDILLVMCARDGKMIAGAINFVGSECLFGRNWGCTEHHPMLHFEVCYYQAIEFAIERGLQRVEAGAQGQHKLARGYLPTHTYSAHWVVNEGFSEAINRFLDEEREFINEEIDYLDGHSPFKST